MRRGASANRDKLYAVNISRVIIFACFAAAARSSTAPAMTCRPCHAARCNHLTLLLWSALCRRLDTLKRVEIFLVKVFVVFVVAVVVKRSAFARTVIFNRIVRRFENVA